MLILADKAEAKGVILHLFVGDKIRVLVNLPKATEITETFPLSTLMLKTWLSHFTGKLHNYHNHVTLARPMHLPV
jgi:hypothetical protein